jgi:sugar-specific transcriptional regulator TrmB
MANGYSIEMDISMVLKRIGLNSGEIKVYLALLKLGSVNVHKIKLETKLHRTSIYDFLDKLINKGLVSSVIKNSINHYQATDPEKLSRYTEEMASQVQKIIPELKKINAFSEKEVTVEVYRGVGGFKTVLKDMLGTKSNLVWLGVDEEKFNKTFSEIIIKQHIRRQKELGIRERILTSDESKVIYDTGNATYRYVSKEHFDPVPIAVYADRVMNLVWDPLTIVLMRNEELANSYRKHFGQLWKLAKKRPKSEVKSIKLVE